MLNMNVPLTAEYYNGTGYAVNTDDACTAIAATDLVLSSPYEAAKTNGTIKICAAGGTSTMTVTHNPFVAGNGLLTFTAPGASCTGFTNIDIDLHSLNKDYLMFDWNNDDGLNDGPYNVNPSGRASFGILSRPKHVIYTREPW